MGGDSAAIAVGRAPRRAPDRAASDSSRAAKIFSERSVTTLFMTALSRHTANQRPPAVSAAATQRAECRTGNPPSNELAGRVMRPARRPFALSETVPQDGAKSAGASMAAEEKTSSKGMTIGLAILFAVMAVSVQQSIAAFLAGALFGALIAQVMHLRGRTQSLQQQLRELQRSLSQLRTAEKPAAQPAAP